MGSEIKSLVYITKIKKWKKTNYSIKNGKVKKDKEAISNRNPELIKEQNI